MAALASSQRLRRLAFVLALTPGAIVAGVLAPALRDPGLLVAGVVLVAAAFVGSRAAEDWARRTSPAQALPSPSPDPQPMEPN